MEDFYRAVLGTIGLFLAMCFARSMRAGPTQISESGLAILHIPLFLAALWLLGLTTHWWAALILVLTGAIVGVAVNRRSLATWATLQLPILIGSAAFTFAGWVLPWSV